MTCDLGVVFLLQRDFDVTAEAATVVHDVWSEMGGDAAATVKEPDFNRRINYLSPCDILMSDGTYFWSG